MGETAYADGDRVYLLRRSTATALDVADGLLIFVRVYCAVLVMTTISSIWLGWLVFIAILMATGPMQRALRRWALHSMSKQQLHLPLDWTYALSYAEREDVDYAMSARRRSAQRRAFRTFIFSFAATVALASCWGELPTSYPRTLITFTIACWALYARTREHAKASLPLPHATEHALLHTRRT